MKITNRTISILGNISEVRVITKMGPARLNKLQIITRFNFQDSVEDGRLKGTVGSRKSGRFETRARGAKDLWKLWNDLEELGRTANRLFQVSLFATNLQGQLVF